MKLKSIRVENYKCIEDSTEFDADQITCFIGKNESGKTALLEALYKLNPVEDEKRFFHENEYPRRHLTTFRQRKGRENENVLTTVWDLDKAEQEILIKIFGPCTIKKPEVIITKGYENITNWSIELEEEKFILHLMESFKLDATERAQIKSALTLKEFDKGLQSIETPTQKQIELRKHVNETFTDKTVFDIVGDLLENYLPKFLYFDTYDRLPGRNALLELKNRNANNTLSFGDKIFLALLDMTSSSIDDMENMQEMDTLIMELEAIENSLTDQIFEYWSQNRNLKVTFRFDSARPADPAPFNKGFIFNIGIYNIRHRATVNFEERSTGFIWFFSFLVWFSQVKKNYGENLFILLDEPGLSLHGRAQQDFLRYINEKLRPNYQVIYTAHSPFMIDLNHIFSIRTVEDRIETSHKNGDSVEIILGTKVGQRILSRDKDTLFPLQGQLGYDITQTLFVGPYVCVVEGPAEYGFINWFSKRLVMNDKEGLDIRWAICPSEGASKISSFVTLFKGRGLNIAVLFDYHEGQKKLVKKLEESGLLEDGHLLKVVDYVDQDEADIEDMVGRELYIHLVNGVLDLPDHLNLPQDRPKGVNKRVVKEVEEFCRTLPPGFKEFDHFLPVEYLHAMSESEVKKLPGLDEAMDRFEKLFGDLRKLI